MGLTIYKYVPNIYAERFLAEGEVLFRSLSYFLACEHDERGDDTEGVRVYEPERGLEITKQTGERVILPGSFRSGVREPDNLFIFSTSTFLSGALASKFQADACVEIADIFKFLARLRTALRRGHRAKLKTLRHGKITYYSTNNPPEAVWALPDQIIMHKPQMFSDQCEYRFAFSTTADALDFENVSVKLVQGHPPARRAESYPKMLLKLGPMSDCCRIHHF